MKMVEIRKKSLLALQSRVDNLRLEIGLAKKALVLGESQDTAKVGKLRQELAQTLTVIKELNNQEKES